MNAAPPTKRAMLAFELKAVFFRAKRFAIDARGVPRRWPLTGGPSGGALLAESSTPLRSVVAETDPREARLIEGKIHNLYVALRPARRRRRPRRQHLQLLATDRSRHPPRRIRRRARAARRLHHPYGRRRSLPTLERVVCGRARFRLRNRRTARAFAFRARLDDRARSRCDGLLELRRSALSRKARAHDPLPAPRRSPNRAVFCAGDCGRIPAIAIRSRRRHRSRAAVVYQLRSSRVHTTSQNTRRELCTSGSILTRRLLARIRWVRRDASNDKRRGVRSDRWKTF